MEELRGEVHELSGTVRELQTQVKALTAALDEERAKSTSSNERVESKSAAVEPGKLQNATGSTNPYSTFPAVNRTSGETPSSTAVSASSQNESLEQRVTDLEDNQQLIDSKLNDQYQTKVESGSHYRLRLSGIVLFNLQENRGTLDNLDFPQIATPTSPFDSDHDFSGSLRQTQIRIEAFGPDLFGARTSADVNFDFAGNTTDEPNGGFLSMPRLRTGTVRLDWKNTSVVAGQDFLFFAPLQPTSLASVAVPPLSWSGELWAWAPQVRVEHSVNFSDHAKLLLQGGILESLTGDEPFPDAEVNRFATWGEQSGVPAVAGRVAWSDRIFGQTFTIGEGGYFGRQFWSFGRHLNGWAATTDWSLPLGTYFTVSGQFFRGNAIGGLAGGIGQNLLLNGNYAVPSTQVMGLDAMGGWAQLTFKPTPKFQINGAFGQDNPFASEVRKYSSTPPLYGEWLTKNQSEFVNFIFQPRSDVMFSLEYRRLQTTGLPNSTSANIFNLGLGYIF
jgi:hypothetical protein